MKDDSIADTLQPILVPLVSVSLGFSVGVIFAAIETWSSERAARRKAEAAPLASATAAAAAVPGEDGRSGDDEDDAAARRVEEARPGKQPLGGGGGRKSKRATLGGAASAAAVIPATEEANGQPSEAVRGSGPGGSQAAAGTGQGGSSGDNTRRSFYRLILAALLCRLVLLPVQGYYFSPKTSEYVHPENGMCIASPGCIFSRTLPDLAFASAFSLLVLFYAQLAGTASSGGPRGLSLILTKRGLFQTGNIASYSAYGVLFFFTGVVNVVPYQAFQTLVWSLLCVIYLALLCLLSYFGPVLLTLLRPSLSQRSALAMRLVAMCLLCGIVFLARAVTFGLAVYRADVRFTRGILPNLLPEDKYGSNFGRDALGYAVLELLPALAILAMMHQGRPPPAVVGQSPTTRRLSPVPSQGEMVAGHIASGAPKGGVMGGSSSRVAMGSGIRAVPGGPHLGYYPHVHSGSGVLGGGGMRRVTSGSAPKRDPGGSAPIVGNRGESISLLGRTGASGVYGSTSTSN